MLDLDCVAGASWMPSSARSSVDRDESIWTTLASSPRPSRILTVVVHDPLLTPIDSSALERPCPLDGCLEFLVVLEKPHCSHPLRPDFRAGDVVAVSLELDGLLLALSRLVSMHSYS